MAHDSTPNNHDSSKVWRISIDKMSSRKPQAEVLLRKIKFDGKRKLSMRVLRTRHL